MTFLTALQAQLASYVAVYGAPLLGYVVLRLLTVSLTLHWMMRRTPEVSEPVPETAAEESADGPPPKDLTFFELDAAKGILLDDVYQDRLERALETGRRTWTIFWQSVFVFLVTVTVAVLVSGIGAESPGAEGGNLPGPPAYVLAGVLLFGVILFVVVGSHYRSIRRVPFLTQIVCLLLMAVISVAAWQVLDTLVYLHALPVILPAIVVIAGYGRIRRAARREGNLKLLILRVFGADRNTSFVFGPLMRSWQYLGSFFTVVDPSYVRYQFSLSSGENRWKLLRFFFFYGVFIFAVSLGSSLVIGYLAPANPRVAALRALDQSQRQELIGMLAWLVLIPLAMLPILVLVKNRFIRNRASLERRVRAGEAQTAGWSGVFKGFPMYCYDNVWKGAVNALLGTSDVVMMDLRGFSPARRGCEYEVGVLVDAAPLQKVVFLVDQAETRSDVFELIRRRWSAMSATSPNRGLEAPVVKIYAPGEEEKRDIPRILALLAASAETGAGPGNAMVSFEGAHPQRAIAAAPARSKAAWRRLPARLMESLDMAVSSPKAAAVVIPLLLLAVLGLLFWRLQPVITAFRAVASPKIVSVLESTPASTPESTPEPTPASPPAAPETPADAFMPKREAHATIASIAGMVGERRYSNPIEVSVDLTGGAAADAYRYGKVNLISATGPDGTPLERLVRAGRSKSDFSVIDHSATDFFTDEPEHPADGLRLKFHFFKPEPAITRIGNLAGNVTLQSVDPEKMVRIDNAGAQLSIPGSIQLNHPKLASIGKVSMVVHDYARETVQMIVEGGATEDVSVRVVDATGKELPSRGIMLSRESATFMFPIAEGGLANARLEVIWGYRSIAVPFEMNDIVITKPDQ